MEFLRRAAPYLSAAVLIVLLYDGYIFYQRWKARRDGEAAARQYEVDQAREVLEKVGGGGLKLNHFYAAPPVVNRGQSTKLCYSVVGAKTVRLDPPVEKTHPSLSYCFEVKPAKSTEYTLTATDALGTSVSSKASVKVQ
ncbi:MAG: hypothetical protein HY820_24485 [Acidobacteria bacterium]|nr:hypothetical protein [Acidobacteriota bacterium]